MGPKATQEGAQSLEDLLEHDDDEAQLIADRAGDDLEREEAKEEEYDYFLDAHHDENQQNNPGYHIIDPSDLETSENVGSADDGKARDAAKRAGDQAVDADDLEEMQDEDLREYRYRNMLEDLKESIDEETPEQTDIARQKGEEQ